MWRSNKSTRQRRTGARYRENIMCWNVTKLSFAAIATVALLALGFTSIVSPAWAAKVKPTTCADGVQLACIEDKLDGIKAQQDEYLTLPFERASIESPCVEGI
jgi:hypothetical protein